MAFGRRYFIWNKYTKELTLKRPLSYVAILTAAALGIVIFVGLASQIIG